MKQPLIITFTVALLIQSGLTTARSNVQQIANGEFSMAQNETPPGPGADWQPVAIPDRWANDARWQQGLTAWYRFRLPDAVPEQTQAIYLQRLSINALVYMNDDYVGTGGSFDEPAARNMHRPLLFVLPASAWYQDKPNFAYVRLRVYPDYAHLVALQIGDYHALKPAYESQYFLQVTLSQILFTIALLTALFGLIFWFFVERNAVNLLFGLTALHWSIYCLNLFVRDIPFGAKTWWWMIHSNLEWAAVCLILFGRRLVDRKFSMPDYGLIAFALVAMIIYATLEYHQINYVSRRIHLVSIVAVSSMNLWLIVEYFKHKNFDALVLGLCLIGVIVLGVNDLIRHSVPVDSKVWQTPFYLLQFGAPVMFIILTSYLVSRYSRAQQQAVAAQQQQQQVRVDERERIYQDLHDDVGAKLLSLVYKASSREEAEIARGALADIREIVSERPNVEIDLEDMVDRVIAESESRCEAAAITCRSQCLISDNRHVSGEFSYHVLKIVRELLTNTVRHAKASLIDIDIRTENSDFHLTYKDNGIGISDTIKPGRGINGIQRRVAGLGGHWQMSRDVSGFEMLISIPY